MRAGDFPQNVSKFDSDFWTNMLKHLSFPVKSAELDFRTLREQRALPSDVESAKVMKLYSDDYVEVALVKFDSVAKLRRTVCSSTKE